MIYCPDSDSTRQNRSLDILSGEHLLCSDILKYFRTNNKKDISNFICEHKTTINKNNPFLVTIRFPGILVAFVDHRHTLIFSFSFLFFFADRTPVVKPKVEMKENYSVNILSANRNVFYKTRRTGCDC